MVLTALVYAVTIKKLCIQLKLHIPWNISKLQDSSPNSCYTIK